MRYKIQEELKNAMKARDALRVSVLRGILAGFQNELVAKGRPPRGELSDEEGRVVIKRLAKQRKESIEQFRAGGRKDLAEKEKNELEILRAYLPRTMSREEILKIAREKAGELNIADGTQTGRLIAAVMRELGGKADGADVKDAVEELLRDGSA